MTASSGCYPSQLIGEAGLPGFAMTWLKALKQRTFVAIVMKILAAVEIAKGIIRFKFA
jgi:hypothetical protein